MALFDSLIDEVNARFNLGDKASSLFPALLALITDQERGGLTGFVHLFERAGLGTFAESWITRGANIPLSDQQLEDALGNGTIKNIAQQAGLKYETAVSALAFLIPQVVDRMTPDGIIPDNVNLISTVGTYLTGTDATSRGTQPIAEKAATETNDLTVSTAGSRSILGWALPLILLAVLLGIIYYTFSRPNQPTRLATPTNTSAPTKQAPNTNSAPASQHSNGSH